MVRDSHVNVLRAVLSDDAQVLDQLGEAPGLDSERDLPILIAMTFIKAARTWFAPTWSGSDVIRFVGQVRSRDHGEHSDVDAQAAEYMLISALSDKPLWGRFDELAKGYTQVVLLAELTRELSSDQLDVLLEGARELANGRLTEGGD
jgi:hypothetical protein